MFKIKKTFLLAPLIILLFLVLYSSAPFVFSQGSNYIPLAPLPNAAPAAGTNFSVYVKGLFALLIGIAAVLAVIMIVIGGVEYMSTDAVSGKSEGKDKITQALYGLFLAIACWLILYTINPNLLNFDVINSVPVTLNPGYYESTPSTDGWYIQFEARCEGYGNTWYPIFYGPTTESECNGLRVPVSYCTSSTTTSYPMSYRNKSCTHVQH